MTSKIKIGIVGTVGLPANYGGFETLVENIVLQNARQGAVYDFTVFSSSKSYSQRIKSFYGAEIKYIPIKPNGPQSIPYDIVSLLYAIAIKCDIVLVLGTSGSIAFPIATSLSNTKIITNLDGIEWRREKWNSLARTYLKLCEKWAIKFSNYIISDNDAISEYIKSAYGANPTTITYGGDHAVEVVAAGLKYEVPTKPYAFTVCRIEPENNVHLMLRAFKNCAKVPLVIVGNWSASEYGKMLKRESINSSYIQILDPIYDLSTLKQLRTHCKFYVHGHSAGGTNPSLVEAMHFGRPIAAFDCDFNRATTENNAVFFKTEQALEHLIRSSDETLTDAIGQKLRDVAKRRYTWEKIFREYAKLFESVR